MLSHTQIPRLPAHLRILRHLASGATSTVYQAENTEQDRMVALKVLHPTQLAQSEARQRFEREAMALRQICHPHVVRIFDFWEIDGQMILELEWVEGQTLKDWLQTASQAWPDPRIWILVQVARALGAVHQEGLVHRDLKPENILLSKEGEVKLIDLGLARPSELQTQLTQTGSVVGSVAYMAPEAINGEIADRSSDLFSFGILAAEILTNQHPFFDENQQFRLRNLLNADHSPLAQKNPKIPARIVRIIESCIAKDRDKRPSSIWKVETELMEVLLQWGTLREAQNSLRASAESSSVLLPALEKKHQRMKDQLRATLSGSNFTLSQALSDLTCFQSQFPNDSDLPAFFEQLRNRPEPPREKQRKAIWWMIPAGAALIFALLFFSMWKPEGEMDKSKSHSVSTQEPIPLSTPLPVAVSTPEPTTTPQAIVKRRNAEVVPTGRLRIIADRDVQAYLNDLPIPANEIRNYATRPGSYRLRLEKPGYPVIENTIRITKDKVTTINTQPESVQ